MKICSKCKESKLLDAFSKQGARLRSHCKACVAAYYAAHREEAYATIVRWQKANPEKVLAYHASYRASHRAEALVASAAWRKANPEKCTANAARWRKANPEKVATATARWQKDNPDNLRANCHTHRARLRNVPSERVLMSVLFDRDKGICGICKKRVYKNARVLCMRPSHDHIIPVSKGGHNTYANAQLAHRRCNSAKGAKLVPTQFAFAQESWGQ